MDISFLWFCAYLCCSGLHFMSNVSTIRQRNKVPITMSSQVTAFCLFRLSLQAGRVFDHTGSVIFSILLSLWAVLFFEFFKRKTKWIAHRWNCSNLEQQVIIYSSFFIFCLYNLFCTLCASLNLEYVFSVESVTSSVTLRCI